MLCTYSTQLSYGVKIKIGQCPSVHQPLTHEGSRTKVKSLIFYILYYIIIFYIQLGFPDPAEIEWYALHFVENRARYKR